MNKKASPKKSEVEEKATKSAALSLMNLNELREIKPAELQKMAISLEIEDAVISSCVGPMPPVVKT